MLMTVEELRKQITTDADDDLLAAGGPADLVAARSTLTGQHLAEYVGAS